MRDCYKYQSYKQSKEMCMECRRNEGIIDVGCSRLTLQDTCNNDSCPSRRKKTFKHKLCKVYDSCKSAIKSCLICCLLLLLVLLVIAIIYKLIQASVLLSQKAEKQENKHGAVAADHTDCSLIGTSILHKGGNAVDAAVAATLCMTVVAPHKTGLGGGGLVMIYSHKEPSKPLVVDFATNTVAGVFSEIRVRIPAVLRGLEFVQSLRGNLAWREVVEPSVSLAVNGFPVTREFVEELSKNPEHRTLFGHLTEGQTLKLPNLAETLKTVASHGTNELYNGSLTRKLLRDSVVPDELFQQLANYEPQVGLAKKSHFNKFVVHYSSNDEALESIIRALDQLNLSMENIPTLEARSLVGLTILKTNVRPLNAETIVQKYSAVASVDGHENYVSIITGLSEPLGLARMSGAGFILDSIGMGNNLTSFAPIIFHDRLSTSGLRGVFASDDSCLIAQILYNFLSFDGNVSSTIEYPRYYHISDGISAENDNRHTVDQFLQMQMDTILPMSQVEASSLRKSINAVVKVKTSMRSHSDSRGGGYASRF